MRIKLTIAGLGLVSASVLLPAPAESDVSEAPTCQGQPATIVADQDTYYEATEGADVIVVRADGTRPIGVRARGGDDLICVIGNLPDDTGPEDDESEIDGGDGIDSLRYIGSDQQDWVEIYNTEQLEVRTAGARDRIKLHYTPTGNGVINAGGGRTHPRVARNNLYLYDANDVVMDLKHQQLLMDGGSYGVIGFERVVAVAGRVMLTGDTGANRLEAYACSATVRGGRGADVLRAKLLRPATCGDPGATLFGQGGDDRLTGTSRDDVLLGGLGRDRASGRAGRDRCSAEVKLSCER